MHNAVGYGMCVCRKQRAAATAGENGQMNVERGVLDGTAAASTSAVKSITMKIDRPLTPTIQFRRGATGSDPCRRVPSRVKWLSMPSFSRSGGAATRLAGGDDRLGRCARHGIGGRRDRFQAGSRRRSPTMTFAEVYTARKTRRSVGYHVNAGPPPTGTIVRCWAARDWLRVNARDLLPGPRNGERVVASPTSTGDVSVAPYEAGDRWRSCRPRTATAPPLSRLAAPVRDRGRRSGGEGRRPGGRRSLNDALKGG